MLGDAGGLPMVGGLWLLPSSSSSSSSSQRLTAWRPAVVARSGVAGAVWAARSCKAGAGLAGSCGAAAGCGGSGPPPPPSPGPVSGGCVWAQHVLRDSRASPQRHAVNCFAVALGPPPPPPHKHTLSYQPPHLGNATDVHISMLLGVCVSGRASTLQQPPQPWQPSVGSPFAFVAGVKVRGGFATNSATVLQTRCQPRTGLQTKPLFKTLLLLLLAPGWRLLTHDCGLSDCAGTASCGARAA